MNASSTGSRNVELQVEGITGGLKLCSEEEKLRTVEFVIFNSDY
jgi:hypothetical protein